MSCEEEIKSNSHTIMTIDIGVIHLGICVSEVAEDFASHEIIWVDLIDITNYRHSAVKTSECTLYHTRNFADWVEHFLQENKPFFDAAELILIEKQPPMGFVVIEQLIFSKFRHKTQLVNPRQMLAYFNLSHLEYDKRKEYVVKIADRELPDHLREQTFFYDRRHDIADCVCILIYYIRRKAEEWKRKKRRENLTRDMSGMTVMDKLELFRFV